MTIAFFAGFTFVSCELGDDNYQNFGYQLLPIETAVFPDTVKVNRTNNIVVTYLRPSDCHFVEGFYYDDSSGNTRTVAMQSRVLIQDDCQDLEEAPVEATLRFAPMTTGFYLFKFYKGTDANGQNLFEEHRIEVTQ